MRVTRLIGLGWIVDEYLCYYYEDERVARQLVFLIEYLLIIISQIALDNVGVNLCRGNICMA
jgi:hypothetical protein